MHLISECCLLLIKEEKERAGKLSRTRRTKHRKSESGRVRGRGFDLKDIEEEKRWSDTLHFMSGRQS